MLIPFKLNKLKSEFQKFQRIMFFFDLEKVLGNHLSVLERYPDLDNFQRKKAEM